MWEKGFAAKSKAVFFCGSFMLFLSCVCYAFVRGCLLMPCGHLLGKGWPLGSRLWCLIVSLLLSRWYPESGVILDCIDSWSLPSFLLCSDNHIHSSHTWLYMRSIVQRLMKICLLIIRNTFCSIWLSKYILEETKENKLIPILTWDMINNYVVYHKHC